MKGDAPRMTQFITQLAKIRNGGMGFGLGIGAPVAS